MNLLIGGRGLIGSAIYNELAERKLRVTPTTRRSLSGAGWFQLDLAADHIPELPMATHVFLVAATPGFAACEGNRTAYRVNVDAPFAIIDQLRRKQPASPPFFVFISSGAVENLPFTAYAHHKQLVELRIRDIGGAIIRPGKVTTDSVAQFAKFVVDVAQSKRAGVYPWTSTQSASPVSAAAA